MPPTDELEFRGGDMGARAIPRLAVRAAGETDVYEQRQKAEAGRWRRAGSIEHRARRIRAESQVAIETSDIRERAAVDRQMCVREPRVRPRARWRQTMAQVARYSARHYQRR